VLQALRELLHLACHRRSRWFAELQLDGQIVVYFCRHTGSLSKKTAGHQRDSGANRSRKISVKNYMSMESSRLAVRFSGLVYTSWPPYADQRLSAVRGQTFAQRSVGPWISAMQGVRRAAIVRPMTLEQLSALAQIVGAGALLASLIFVGLQIRQNTQSQRVVAVESLAAAIAAINVPAMQSPALGTALATALKDWSLASHDERVIAHYFLFCFFKLHEQAWYQYRSRVLDDAQWAGWENLIRAYYHSPGVQQVWWPSRRQAFSPQFQAYLAATEPPQAITTLADLFGENAMTPVDAAKV